MYKRQLLVIGMRGHWRQLRNHPAADLAVIMLTLVLPFMAAFLHVFTGGDPQVFTNVADYTSQEMIVRLAIFVAVCVLASIGIGVAWFWRPHTDHHAEASGDDAESIQPAPEAIQPAPWRPVLHHWALLMAAFWLVQVLFFTTFFTNTVQGLASGVVGSLGYWVAQQGVKRGEGIAGPLRRTAQFPPLAAHLLSGWEWTRTPVTAGSVR